MRAPTEGMGKKLAGSYRDFYDPIFKVTILSYLLYFIRNKSLSKGRGISFYLLKERLLDTSKVILLADSNL
jgi:hypothetical protein